MSQFNEFNLARIMRMVKAFTYVRLTKLAEKIREGEELGDARLLDNIDSMLNLLSHVQSRHASRLPPDESKTVQMLDLMADRLMEFLEERCMRVPPITRSRDLDLREMFSLISGPLLKSNTNVCITLVMFLLYGFNATTSAIKQEGGIDPMEVIRVQSVVIYNMWTYRLVANGGWNELNRYLAHINEQEEGERPAKLSQIVQDVAIVSVFACGIAWVLGFFD